MGDRKWGGVKLGLTLVCVGVCSGGTVQWEWGELKVLELVNDAIK